MKKIAILGATGSIGTQTLQVVEAHPEDFAVVALTTNRKIDLLEEQIRKYRPALAAVMDEEAGKVLRDRVADTETKVVTGMEGLTLAATLPEADIVLTAVVGMVGLLPTLRAIEAGKDIALANKETLVAGGALVMEAAKEKGVKILPVDSEHSAIFQCLESSHDKAELDKIWLTASGGPFRGYSREQLQKVTVKEALKHPNWAMGAKITVDSATMMNKGLELIEATWLFEVTPKEIEIVVHPESIVHSAVAYRDGAVLAQLGVPDMRVAIQYALTYPNRMPSPAKPLSLEGALHFEKPDREVFRTLVLAEEAQKIGGTMPAVLNGANEAAVGMFLEGKIGFLDIEQTIEKVMQNHSARKCTALSDILEADAWARRRAGEVAGV